MRSFLFVSLAAAVSFVPSGTSAATRNFGITGFEKVRIDGPYRVRLSTGTAPFARATGDARALDRLAIEMRGDTLLVRAQTASWGSDPGRDLGPIEITLGTHDLNAAWLNGSGTLAIDRVKALSFDLSVQGSGRAEIRSVDADKLNVSLNGTASSALAGRAAIVTAVVRGMSSLESSGLVGKDSTIGAEGAATIEAFVANAATVTANGPATIRLYGRPTCTLRIAGSATVTGCK